jgi:hypothetical protein
MILSIKLPDTVQQYVLRQSEKQNLTAEEVVANLIECGYEAMKAENLRALETKNGGFIEPPHRKWGM